MNGAFYIGATGLDVQQRTLEVIAQNVTNLNTNTYKRAEMRFAELVGLPAVVDGVAPVARAATQSAAGLAVADVTRVFSQGALRSTDHPLDLAISGDGFLEVLGPGGQTYLWRGGALRIDADGMLQTAEGFVLRALVNVPHDATELRIKRDGSVRALSPGDSAFRELGQLDIVMPEDLGELEPAQGGYYRVRDAFALRSFLPGEDGKGVFVQGAIEASNVELSTELVGLMLAQRAFAASAQIVQAGDQLMAIANGLRR